MVHRSTFLVGPYLVGFEVDEEGRPVVAFGTLEAEGQGGEVEHVLSLPEAFLLGMRPPIGHPAVIKRDGHEIEIGEAEFWQLRDMLQAGQALLASYQDWLAEKAPGGVRVSVVREWSLPLASA